MLRRMIAVICCILSLIAVIVIILFLFGLKPFILQSASMEPQYTTGSMVWVQTNTKLDAVEAGDVIVFRNGRSIIFHRVISINDDQYELRGDANSLSQTITLNKSNYIGKMAFSIPWIGSVVGELIHHKLIVFVLGCALLIIACLPFKTIVLKKKDSL